MEFDELDKKLSQMIKNEYKLPKDIDNIFNVETLNNKGNIYEFNKILKIAACFIVVAFFGLNGIAFARGNENNIYTKIYELYFKKVTVSEEEKQNKLPTIGGYTDSKLVAIKSDLGYTMQYEEERIKIERTEEGKDKYIYGHQEDFECSHGNHQLELVVYYSNKSYSEIIGKKINDNDLKKAYIANYYAKKIMLCENEIIEDESYKMEDGENEKYKNYIMYYFINGSDGKFVIEIHQDNSWCYEEFMFYEGYLNTLKLEDESGVEKLFEYSESKNKDDIISTEFDGLDEKIIPVKATRNNGQLKYSIEYDINNMIFSKNSENRDSFTYQRQGSRENENVDYLEMDIDLNIISEEEYKVETDLNQNGNCIFESLKIGKYESIRKTCQSGAEHYYIDYNGKYIKIDLFYSYQGNKDKSNCEKMEHNYLMSQLATLELYD